MFEICLKNVSRVPLNAINARTRWWKQFSLSGSPMFIWIYGTADLFNLTQKASILNEVTSLVDKNMFVSINVWYRLWNMKEKWSGVLLFLFSSKSWSLYISGKKLIQLLSVIQIVSMYLWCSQNSVLAFI